MSEFVPSNFPTLGEPTPKPAGLQVSPHATVPMTVADLDALVTASCCPCDVGIFGACKSGSPTRSCENATPERLHHLWRLAWVFLSTGDFVLPPVSATPSGGLTITPGATPGWL